MKCKDCEKEFNKEDIKQISPYGWKCPSCYTINNLKSAPPVYWKCDTGTVRRG